MTLEQWKKNTGKYPSHEDCIHALLDGGDTFYKITRFKKYS